MRASFLRCLIYALLSLTVFACASNSPELDLLIKQNEGEFRRSHLIESVAFFPQQKYQCGPAALATLLTYSGVNVTPDELISHVYVPDLKGSLQVEMLAATRNFKRLAYPLSPDIKSLFQEIDANNPVLVLQNLGFDFWPRWHYAVVTGYDLSEQIITLHSGTNKNYRLKLATFERTWQGAENWAMLALPAGKITPSMNAEEYFKSALAFQRVNSASLVEKVFLAGVKRWPQELLLNLAYANFLYESRRLQDAISHYNSILYFHPKDAPTHNNLAQALSETGQYALAEEHALKAVALGGEFEQRYRQTLQEIQTAELASQVN